MPFNPNLLEMEPVQNIFANQINVGRTIVEKWLELDPNRKRNLAELERINFIIFGTRSIDLADQTNKELIEFINNRDRNCIHRKEGGNSCRLVSKSHPFFKEILEKDALHVIVHDEAH